MGYVVLEIYVLKEGWFLCSQCTWRAGATKRVILPAVGLRNRFLGSFNVYKFGLRRSKYVAEVAKIFI
jgi:hypothetical protein